MRTRARTCQHTGEEIRVARERITSTWPFKFENMKSFGSGFFFSQLNSSFLGSAFLPPSVAGLLAGLVLFAGAGGVLSTLAFLGSGSCDAAFVSSAHRAGTI